MYIFRKCVYICSLLLLFFKACHATRLISTSETSFVKELSINSSVSITYANVLVRSLVINFENKTNEVSFQVRIPRDGYITNFTIITNGRTINAVIKDKNAADEDYNEAKEEGVSAGTVTQQTNVVDDIDRNVFTVRVNVAAKTSLEFRLQYEELLQMNAGIYSQKLFIDSDHVVPQIGVFCEFKEKQKFKQLSYRTPIDATKFMSSEEEILEDGTYSRKIIWKPNEQQQANAQFGFTKPFEIEYELEAPSNDGGIIFFNGNGEFVHFFSSISCDETKVMVKQIVFVIDISLSMTGDKINQVKQTLTQRILPRLRSRDYFNIIVFNQYAILWKKRFLKVTPYNIENAKAFITSNVSADGYTNINDALLKAIGLFDQRLGSPKDKRFGQMIVFLTDGSPTAGVTDIDDIRQNVREVNFYQGVTCCKSVIHTVAFGESANRDFLRKLAHENEGKLTIVRDINDESESLIELFNSIESPFYKNIEFAFTADKISVPDDNITRPQFKLLDCKARLVVAGRTYPNAEIRSKVVASTNNDSIVFGEITTVRARNINEEKLSRLFVYEKINQLLETAEISMDPSRRRTANAQALELSLNYGFVTPLTSLVVTDFLPKRLTNVPPQRNSNVMTRQSNLFDRSDLLGTNINVDDSNIESNDLNIDNVYMDNILQYTETNSVRSSTCTYSAQICLILIKVLFKLVIYLL